MCVCVYTVYTPVYRPAGWLNFKECGGLKTCPPRDAPASWEASGGRSAEVERARPPGEGRAVPGEPWPVPGPGRAAKHTRNFQVLQSKY